MRPSAAVYAAKALLIGEQLKSIMIAAVKVLNKKPFIQVISVSLILFIITFTSSILYAQDESSGIKKKLIQFNKDVSEEIDKAADNIDKSVSPNTPGEVKANNSKIFFVVGSDFTSHGDVKGNFRFGAHLHLPRFEKYWSVKFANQDEKRDRGQSSATRRLRTRKANDDVFVGVNFFRNWDRIDITYKPKIAINDGVGLDHSIEAETKYEFDKFRIDPGLEFFANHNDGTGSSASLRFSYELTKLVTLEEGNDARFLNLHSHLAVNHYIGFGYTPTDRLSFTTHYFRSFRNLTRDYELSAYGAYIASNYTIYKNILSVETKPYLVYERDDNFRESYGVLVNFRVTF
jgi:hypothetical protein